MTPKNDTFHALMMTASACLKNTVLLKILDHCNWHPETMMVSALKCMALQVVLWKQYRLNRNIYQIHCIYATYGSKCSSKKYRIHIH